MVSAPAGPAWTSQYTRDLTDPLCPCLLSSALVSLRPASPGFAAVTRCHLPLRESHGSVSSKQNTGPFSRRNVSMHESLQSCVCQWLGAPGSFRPSKNRCRTASVGERRRDSGGLVVLIAAEAEYREKQDAPKCERESPEDTLSEGAGHTDVNPVYGIQLD